MSGEHLIGGDLFDFWVGPFYVGFFGVSTAFAFWDGMILVGASMGDTWNIWRINIARPTCPMDWGSLLAEGVLAEVTIVPSAPSFPGYARPKWPNWGGATCSLCLRVTVLAYVTLVVIVLCCWVPGDTASPTASSATSTGCRMWATIPAFPTTRHMIAITFFFTTMALSMHGSLILMATDPRDGEKVKTGERTPSSGTTSAIRLALWAFTDWACSLRWAPLSGALSAS